MAYDENGNIVPNPIPASVVLGEAVSQHPVLTSLKEQIANLEKQLEDVTRVKDYSQKIATERGNKLFTMENTLRSVLEQLFSEESISENAAQYIAEACEIELTKTVSVSGTISFSGTLEVSIFQDIENIEYHANTNDLSVSFYGETLENLDYSVEDVEVD